MKPPEETIVNMFVAVDELHWEKVVSCFDKQVLLDYSSMSGGEPAQLSPAQIVESWKGILPGFTYTHHQLGNFQSITNGEHASVFCYGTATHYLQDPDGSVWTVVGTYDFELGKSADGWKIQSMKFNFKYQDGNTKLPEKAVTRLKGD